MKVRSAKAASPTRQRVETPKPAAKTHNFPAPVRGWVQNENLATMGPGTALVLDNWICSNTGIRVRGGSARYATLTDDGPVTSLFSYHSGDLEKLFAATPSFIYDISTVADSGVLPDHEVIDQQEELIVTWSESEPEEWIGVWTEAGPSDWIATILQSQNSGYYSTQQFGNASGDYLYAVNGTNHAILYDGTGWQAVSGTTTGFSITGIDTKKLSAVWAYANRIFFIEGMTMNAWYLPVGSVGGAATKFSLAGMFNKGGSLLFGATWSIDAGDGLNDLCVFVTTEGEVAVYSGTYPGDASWQIQGVYQIGKPRGKNAFMRAGGDLLIATDIGLISLGTALNKDIGALEATAVSRTINTFWNDRVKNYDQPWEMVKWPEENFMLLTFSNEFDDGYTLACNLQTGAWSRFTNIGARCNAYFQGYLYVGGNDGVVKRLQTGGSDMGNPYTAVYVGNHEQLGAFGAQKTILQARSVFIVGSDINPLISAQVDYSVTLSPPPGGSSDASVGTWDNAQWDVDVWDASNSLRPLTSRWSAIGRTGYAVGPEIQITFNGVSVPTVELVSTEMTYFIGGVVT